MKTINALSFKSFMFVGALFCVILLSAAYFLEFAYTLSPCPLCLLQRYAVWILAGLFLLAALQNPKIWGRYIYLVSMVVISVLGAGLAFWQIWLQHLPPSETPACISSLEKLFEYYPLQEVIQKILLAPGECAKVEFTFLGLSLAEGSFLMFLFLLGFLTYIFYALSVQKLAKQ